MKIGIGILLIILGFGCLFASIEISNLRSQINYYQILNTYGKDEGIAGYKIVVNDYTSGLFRSKEEALAKLTKLQKGIKPYPENLKYLEFITVMYE